MKPKSNFLIIAACMVLLSACGNKGPLVLPPKPVSAQHPADHAASSLPPVNEAGELPISAEEDSDE